MKNLTVGDRLRAERERIGLSQAALGTACGVKKNTQLNYEKNSTSPSVSYLLEAQKKGIDVWYVIEGYKQEVQENESLLIGDRLREERKRLGLNQTEFGETGGVKLFTQSHYETGKRMPNGEYLANVAAIGVDVQYVLTGVKAEQGNQPSLPIDVDAELLVRIAEKLEQVATSAGKHWPVGELVKISLEIYGFLREEENVSDDKVDRVIRLVVNR